MGTAAPEPYAPASGPGARTTSGRGLTTGGSLRRFVHGRDIAVVYAGIVVAVTVVLALLPPAVHAAVVNHTSTNLDNLRHHPISSLVLSAFVLGSPLELAEIPLLVWAYGAVQRALGRGSTVVTGVFGHAGATLFVAVLIATGVTHGLVHPAVTHAEDVGVSYGLAAAAALCVLTMPRRWRLPYALALSAVLVVALLLVHTFTDVGHATAFCVGLCLALVVAAARRAAEPPPAGIPEAG